MDTTVALLIDSSLAPSESTSELAFSSATEDANSLTLINRFAMNSLPENLDPNGLMFPLVFALHFGEMADSVQLEAPVSFISASNPAHRVFSWVSPDGLLEMEVSIDARLPWYITETLNGVSVERQLLSDSLPGYQQ